MSTVAAETARETPDDPGRGAEPLLRARGIVMRFGGLLAVDDVDLDLGEWGGLLLGGGAFTYSDPPASKSPAQLRAERDLTRLLDDVVAADFPFLGACYGIGTLGTHQGGTVDREHPAEAA